MNAQYHHQPGYGDGDVGDDGKDGRDEVGGDFHPAGGVFMGRGLWDVSQWSVWYLISSRG